MAVVAEPEPIARFDASPAATAAERASPPTRANMGRLRRSRAAPDSIVIASKATRSRLGDCGGGFVWIASLCSR